MTAFPMLDTDGSRATQARGPREAIIVLGMHRSGTSALARVLNILGCETPRTLMEPDSANQSGYWESPQIAKFNDRILHSGGATWHDWYEFNPSWFNSIVANSLVGEAVSLIEAEFGREPLIVVKDPRMTLVFPFWRRVFDQAGYSIRCVILQRHPLEVCASLNKRNNISLGRAALIWLRYSLDAEYYSRGLPRSFISYDRLMQNFRSTVSKLETQLGISWPRVSERAYGEIANYLSSSLRHHNERGNVAKFGGYGNPWVETLFGTLERWCEHGELADDHESLDDIRRAFRRSEQPFSRFVSEFDGMLTELVKAKAALANAMAEGKETAQREQTLRAEQDRLEAALVTAEKAARQAEARAAHAEEAQAALAAREQTLRAEQDSLEAALVTAEKAARQAEARAAHAEEAQAALAAREQTLRAEQDSLEAALADFGDQQRQTESALRQRAHEAEQTALELRVAQAALEQSARRVADLEGALNKRDEHIVELTGKHASALEELAARFEEIGALTRHFAEREDMLDTQRQRLAHRLSMAIGNILDNRDRRAVFLQRLRQRRQATLLQDLGLFDAAWYAEFYKDVAEAGMDPALHFVRHGCAEGRAPSPELLPDSGPAP